MVEVVRLAWLKFWKRCERSDFAMPIPVSCTWISIQSPAVLLRRYTESVIVPFSVNFEALLRRFIVACRSLVESVETIPRSSGHLTRSLLPFLAIIGSQFATMPRIALG